MRPTRASLVATVVATALACSCDSGAADECPASTKPDGAALCLCAPFEQADPPDSTAGAPVVDWAVSAGADGDDSAEIEALPEGEVLVATSSSSQQTALLERIAADGQRAWQVSLPAGDARFAATDSGEIITLFTHDVSGGVTVGDRLLTDAELGVTFFAPMDGASGAFEDAIELPALPGDASPSFEVDDGGLFAFRTSGAGGEVYRYDFAGVELWHKSHELGAYVAVNRAAGGVILAGGSQGALVMRRLDAELDETWEYVHPGFEDPTVTAQALDASTTGRVAIAFTLERMDPDSGETEREFRLVSFDADSSVTMNIAMTSPAEGIAYIDEDDVVAWRATAAGETPGWRLTQYGTDGSTTWTWTMPARNDYASNVRRGDLEFRDGHLFASGAYVGAIDLGREVQIASTGCTDHFVARFGL